MNSKTSDRPENSAADRLELIAEFLVELSSQRSGVVQPLQALILEDFFITGARRANTRPGVSRRCGEPCRSKG